MALNKVAKKWVKALRSGKYTHGIAARMNETILDRLVSRVQETETCWLWSGGKNSEGYGYLYVKPKLERVVRIVAFLEDLPLEDSLCVMHTCDNPPCVNPSHLSIGSLTDNNRDRSVKNRNRDQSGNFNNMAKLTEADVREIRRLYKEDSLYQHEIGEMFGVSQTNVGLILRGERWAHIPEEVTA